MQYEIIILYNNFFATKKNAHLILHYNLYGSFVSDTTFNNIDIAVKVKDIPNSIVEYALQCELEFMKALGKYIIDVRLLKKHHYHSYAIF